MIVGTAASAQDPATKAQADLPTALAAKHITLAAGLASATAKGRPISAEITLLKRRLFKTVTEPWDDVPLVSDSYVTARDVIVRRLERLLDALA